MQAETPSLVSMVSPSIFNWSKSNRLHILPVVEWKNMQCASRRSRVAWHFVPQLFDRPEFESHSNF